MASTSLPRCAWCTSSNLSTLPSGLSVAGKVYSRLGASREQRSLHFACRSNCSLSWNLCLNIGGLNAILSSVTHALCNARVTSISIQDWSKNRTRLRNYSSCRKLQRVQFDIEREKNRAAWSLHIKAVINTRNTFRAKHVFLITR